MFTVDQWRDELEAAGFSILEARAYVNPWILEIRYQGRVWLHAPGIDRPGCSAGLPGHDDSNRRRSCVTHLQAGRSASVSAPVVYRPDSGRLPHRFTVLLFCILFLHHWYI